MINPLSLLLCLVPICLAHPSRAVAQQTSSQASTLQKPDVKLPDAPSAQREEPEVPVASSAGVSPSKPPVVGELGGEDLRHARVFLEEEGRPARRGRRITGRATEVDPGDQVVARNCLPQRVEEPIAVGMLGAHRQ